MPSDAEPVTPGMAAEDSAEVTTDSIFTPPNLVYGVCGLVVAVGVGLGVWLWVLPLLRWLGGA